MKLSVWSSYYYELSPEDAVLEFEKHDYRYCELSDEHALVLMARGDAAEEGQKFKSFADAHHVEFLQGHLILQAKIGNSEDIELLKSQLDLFRAIGIKAAVLHCDGMDRFPDLDIDAKREKNIRALQQLIDHIADTDMVICLENLRHPLVRSADDLMYFIDTMRSPHLGICLDTGHLNLTEHRDQKAFIQRAGKHIKALHIADNEGETDQHMMPFGSGKVDVCEVITELKKIGYDGLFNLEIPGEKSSVMAVRGFKLDYIKTTYDYLDSMLS